MQREERAAEDRRESRENETELEKFVPVVDTTGSNFSRIQSRIRVLDERISAHLAVRGQRLGWNKQLARLGELSEKPFTKPEQLKS